MSAEPHRTAKRFLFVAPVYAASAKTGGGQRTGHVYRAVAALGEVDVWLMSEPAFERDLARQEPEFAETFSGAASVRIVRSTAAYCLRRSPIARLWHALKPRGWLYRPDRATLAELNDAVSHGAIDAIVGRYLHATSVSGALDQDRVPVVVDLDDLEEVVLRAERDSPATRVARRLRLIIEQRRIAAMVRSRRRRCAHIFIASAEDKPLVAHPSVSVLPNIPATEPVEAPTLVHGDPPVVLFVGSFGHAVNRTGLARFIEVCWPGIRRDVPDAILRIVGSGGWESLREELEAHAGVEVRGRTARLAPEYAAATIAVAPLYEGAGTKIKVLEALSYGCAIVATRHAARGFDSLVGHGLVASPRDSDMVASCVDLLRRPVAREPAREGQALVGRLYSFDAFRDRVQEGLASAIAGAHPAG